MSELFFETFGKYGRCVQMPDKAYLPGRYCWKLAVNLDNSFDFVLHAPAEFRSDIQFLGFFAGYSDSEGCWCIYSDKGHASFAFVIESQDKSILISLVSALKKRGLHPLFYQNVGRGKARLELRRRSEVIGLASQLIPFSRHREKIAKMSVILRADGKSWEELQTEVDNLRDSVKREVAKFVKRAESQYKKVRRRANPEGSSASLV
jgi:hypothetical protein